MTEAAVMPDATGPIPHLMFAFGLTTTPLEVSEAWSASGATSRQRRLIDACNTLGLEGAARKIAPTKVTAMDLPCIIMDKATGDLTVMLGRDGDTFQVLQSGDTASQHLTAKEMRKTFRTGIIGFRLPDQDSRGPKARLKALNPLSSLGLSKITWVLLAALFSNILGLATSLFVMVVYDRVLPNRAVESLYALAIGVAIAVLFDSLLRSARGRLIETSTKAADVRVTEDIFDQYVAVANQKTRKSVGELANIMRDFETYREFMTTAMVLTFVDLPFVLLFILVIWQISSWLFLVPLIAIPIVLILVLGVQPLIARSSRAASKSAQTRHGLLVEVLGGLDALRVTGAYALMKHRFLSQARIHGQAMGTAKSYHQLVGTMVSTVQQAVQVGVIVLGFHLFVSQSITMGAIIAAVILSGRAMGPVARLG
ncbi:MAG: ABC transporter transmembrane domain-containing protein [Planktomarina sp.]